ncbi:hypothetical protein COJ53_00630 [Bacillus cereus]|nr:hypothetical protein COJ53_00630 [Bacillus cereus]
MKMEKFHAVEFQAKCLIEENPRLNLLLDKWVEAYNQDTKDYRINATEVFRKADIIQRYLFSQIEEIHKYAYNASFELILFVKHLENRDDFFFSPSYFFINATFKVMGAWDRLIKFLGVVHDIAFNENQKKNTFDNVYKSLKKNKDFKESKAFCFINNLKSSGKFKVIDDVRKDNDHNLSRHVKVETDDELLSDLEDLLEHCRVLYGFISYCVDLLSNVQKINCKAKFIFDTFSIEKSYDLDGISRGLEVFMKNNSLPDKIQNISVLIIEQIQGVLSCNPSSLMEYSAPPLYKIYIFLSDIVFRLHESIRSIGLTYNLYSEGVHLGYEDLDKYSIYFEGMNYRYFIYSSLFRVYNVYDKLGHIILDLFEGEKPKHLTFENIIAKNIEEINIPPIQFSKEVIESQPYKDLYNNRQEHYHYLVSQEYLSPNVRELIDFELVRVIIINIEKQINIIKMIGKVFFPMVDLVLKIPLNNQNDNL